MFKFSGKKLAEIRKQAGFTQADLARMISRGGNGFRQTVDRWERGERKPSGRTIGLLASALGCNPGRFFVEEADERDAG